VSVRDDRQRVSLEPSVKLLVRLRTRSRALASAPALRVCGASLLSCRSRRVRLARKENSAYGADDPRIGETRVLVHW